MPVHLAPLSRRRFLGASVATGMGMLVARSSLAAGGSADPDRWILLSDIHIPADRQRANRDIRPVANFEKARSQYLAQAADAAGVIVSGDLAINEGQAGDYATLAQLVKPIRKAGIPLHLALGNHDHRENLYRAFPEARPAADIGLADKCVSIVETRHANWFLLDSLVKTLYTPGRMGPEQLAWLGKALDARRDKPALVVAHHNPAGTGEQCLEDYQEMLDVLLPRKQVKAYLYGHTHRWEFAQVEGLHLVNLPTLVWVFDETSPRGWVDARLAANALKLELHAIDEHPSDGEIKQLAWRAG